MNLEGNNEVSVYLLSFLEPNVIYLVLAIIIITQEEKGKNVPVCNAAFKKKG